MFIGVCSGRYLPNPPPVDIKYPLSQPLMRHSSTRACVQSISAPSLALWFYDGSVTITLKLKRKHLTVLK